MPLEAVSGIVIWTAMRPILQERASENPRLWLVLAIICVSVLAFTKPIGWGRIGYGKALVVLPVPKLAPHSLVFMAGAPIGFVVPYLNGQGSSFVSLDWLENGSAEFPVVARLVKGTTAIRLLTNVPIAQTNATVIDARLARFGLAYSESSCLPVRSPLQQLIRLCDVVPRPK